MKHSYFTPSHHKLIIYQLFVRLFGNSNSRNKPYGTIKENGVGKFNDISVKALKALKELGITHIWFTGVLEHSSLTDYSKFGIPADNPFIVKGRAGSPYAIRDYYDVSADLAVDVNRRLDEFDEMLKRTHDEGLKAVIDFIPNHVSRSYRSDKKPNDLKDFGELDDRSVFFDPQNNFLYVQGESFHPPADYIPLGGNPLPRTKKFTETPARVTGNDVYSAYPSLNDWFETIKLNFGVVPIHPHDCNFDPLPRTWQMLLDVLLYWCKRGVDGFRCDMAEMVPAEFWEWVIPCVKSHYPDVIFIAEIYKPELYEHYLDCGNFDYLYDKVRLYDTLVSLLKGNGKADDLTNCVRTVEQFPERMLSFLENHDEERIAWQGFTGDPFAAIPAMTVCATVSAGPVMIYNGQEVGETGNGNVGFAGERGRTSIFDYSGMLELQKWTNKGKFDGKYLSDLQKKLRLFYSRLLNLAGSSEAINCGSYYDLQYINRHNQSEGFDERYIYAFLRYTSIERMLIIVNFNKTKSYELVVKIPADAWKLMGLEMKNNYNFKDVLSDNYEFNFNAVEVANEKDRMSGVELSMAPHSAYILKLEKISL